ncbi:TonB-dependent receptor [Novosphingobium profundi]|uniref:TonB-dependent receptor n=1 Tax=Novosphingobium profundi TaxID=1774954 RepID=UPI001BDA5146|nr:TonB-dependent receptor [Novosphingobium profundi]MBT0669369.1 TonB-dependent receptor [Novosphingobium profundi]
MRGKSSTTSIFRYCTSILAITAAGLCAQTASAQSADNNASASSPEQPSGDLDDTQAREIIVTGFRASLQAALADKREETAAIDTIKAEDIGKFPDSNLAESMQRIPGVALARGDGGEGKNISVRGLGAQFTRVRINGMEGTAQTGSSDIYGAGNSGRSFDFNVFPTEIFSALTVRKTPSADVEEGSLGATVDLAAPRPFDNADDFVLSATARGVYNEVSKRVDPRMSGLVSYKLGDTGLGILASGAYQRRHIREVGYSAVDILSANQNGMFCSPLGVTPQSPATSATTGADAANCSTGNPRTGSVDAYNTVYNARRDDLPDTPGSGAFFPRIPRYTDSQQNQERIGGTLSLQYQPDDDTDISLDLMYSKFNVTRDDNYIEAISFGRSASNQGYPMMSLRDVTLDENGSVQYALLDGVDVRSESLHSEFSSTFKQANLNFSHQFNDRLRVSGMFGLNQSRWDDKIRFRYYMDALDVDGFALDFGNGASTPNITYGFDVSDPNAYQYGASPGGGVVTGGIDLQGKPQSVVTDGMTAEFNADYDLSNTFKLKFGGQYRRSRQATTQTSYYTADLTTQNLPAGTSLADITRQITGLDKLWGHGAPSSWAVLDWKDLYDTFGIADFATCGVECGATNPLVREEEFGAYGMVKFDFSDALGFGVRGDAGVRYVKTNQFSSGYIRVADSSSPTGVVGQYASVNRSYDDWLPSANIVVEPMDNLLLRFSAAEVMSRPELGVLTPTSGVNPITRSGTVNNPYLDPIRAKTFDAAVEWYFRPGSLLSAAFFYKDIGTYIQSISSQVPFNELGLPDALLDGSNTLPTELFTITRPVNTPGGKLKGIELNAQVPFNFLDGFFGHFGVLGNFTYVTSKIEYCLTSVDGVCTVSTKDDLVGLSKETASGTLYYEDSKFSIRSTVNYRGPFIRGIPASPGSDIQGNSSTIYVDASASYAITENFKLIVEGTNLTDEQNRLYIDSTRNDTLFQTRVGRTFTFGVNARF